MKFLIVTSIDGAENCVSAVGRLLEQTCDLARTRKAAIAALHRTEYDAVVLDESFASFDPSGADLIWEDAQLAIPLQINFALAGAQRIAREMRMALARREKERALAHEAAAAALQSELKSTLAGLLLHSELALAEHADSSPLQDRLRLVADLAGTLRKQLSASASAQV